MARAHVEQFERSAMRRVRVALLLLALCSLSGLFAGDLTSERAKRYLVFPVPGNNTPTKVQLILGLGLPMEVDVSLIIGYVLKFNYVLPYNASYLTDSYVRYDRSIDHGNDDPDHEGEAPVISRWEIYEMLESIVGDSGKACLLRAICEASAAPFTAVHSLASQLIHLLLTPSTTSEPFRTDFDRVYRAAEIMGRQSARSCDSLFPECLESPLEYFTEVYEQSFA